jgi:hypothetical protein
MNLEPADEMAARDHKDTKRLLSTQKEEAMRFTRQVKGFAGRFVFVLFAFFRGGSNWRA